MTDLTQMIDALRPLHRTMDATRPGDWLSVHPEPGQTFREYVGSDPVTPGGGRNTVYVQPLGDLQDRQRDVVVLTAGFIGPYLNVPVQTREALPLSLVPPEARRVHPSWGVRQLLSRYILQQVLTPRLPDDAAAYVAFTAEDLWPGEGWNFVFGQASLRHRVGVWSIYRNGDPEADQATFRLCLLRTIKTATHELGHMFSMQHCTGYRCAMNGSNTLEEKDRRPLALCPECLAKVCWATGADPVERYRKLLSLCRDHGLQPQGEFYEESLNTLTARDRG
ncbi:MAG: archaemetzincin [Candidatus Brocadiaceae bacterium]|jgi:archaemetzincin